MIPHISLNQSPNLGDNNQADSCGLITRSDKVGYIGQPSAQPSDMAYDKVKN